MLLVENQSKSQTEEKRELAGKDLAPMALIIVGSVLLMMVFTLLNAQIG